MWLIPIKLEIKEYLFRYTREESKRAQNLIIVGKRDGVTFTVPRLFDATVFIYYFSNKIKLLISL